MPRHFVAITGLSVEQDRSLSIVQLVPRKLRLLHDYDVEGTCGHADDVGADFLNLPGSSTMPKEEFDQAASAFPLMEVRRLRERSTAISHHWYQ